ncbi:MAG: hypothetical protein AB8F94_11145 [Saprospiraceae bacterium]
MKLLKPTLFLLALLCIVLSTQSCKDACDDIDCQNGGICEEGSCNCPDGFSGVNCEIEDLCVTQNVDCQNGGTCFDGACDCPEGVIGSNCESFDPTKVQFLLDGGYSPQVLFEGGISLDSLYGKVYKDGLIFYLNTDNGTGMVASMSDLTLSNWGCYVTDNLNINNVTTCCGTGTEPELEEIEEGARVGDGSANTDAIMGCTAPIYASKFCRELGLEWFSPSRGELNLMYINLHVKGHGGFDTGTKNYWSSTERGTYSAWSQNFLTGDRNVALKDFDRYVRAAKAF